MSESLANNETVAKIVEVVDEYKDHPAVVNVLEKVRGKLLEKAQKLEDEHSLFMVLRVTMEAIEVEKIKDMNKRQIAETILKELINEAEMSDDKKEICVNLVNCGAIGDTINLVVSATKGELELNKKTRKNLLSCLGKCISSANN